MLGKRAGSLVDTVRESRCVLAVLKALQPGPGRVVDPLRHQIGELCVVEKDPVGRTRTPTDVLPEKSQVMAEYALSFLEFLGAKSVRLVSERKPLEDRFSRTCLAELPSHQTSPGISGYRIRRRG
jgi:hypothetical protein